VFFLELAELAVVLKEDKVDAYSFETNAGLVDVTGLLCKWLRQHMLAVEPH
jgi:hypothetical protein